MTQQRKLAIGVVTIAMLVAVGIFAMQGSADDAFARALGVCASDPQAGAAEIGALKRIHGEGSVPRKLRVDAALCELKGAVKDY